jgi:hypothetical protein
MAVYNWTEDAVRAEIERLKEGTGEQAESCWCALCEADVIALAMTTLPPRYCTKTTASPEEPASAGSVKSAVFSAASRVRRRPKHTPAHPEQQGSMVHLVNITFEEGAALVATLMHRSESACNCRICQHDTLAYALNRYPPKYGVVHGGRSNLPSYQRDFIRHELEIIISHAAGVVTNEPRHGAILPV